MAKRNQAKSAADQTGEAPRSADVVRPMYSLPQRFQASPEPDRRFVSIVDRESGNSVLVAAAAFGEVRRLLGAFFGGEYEGDDTFIPNAAGYVPATEPGPDQRPVEAQRTKAPAAPGKPAAQAEASGAVDEDAAEPEAVLAGESSAPHRRRGKVAHKKADAAPAAEALPAPAPEPEPQAEPIQASPGWLNRIEGDDYVLEYEETQDGAPGYRVTAAGETVAQVHKDAKGKFVLKWLHDKAAMTPHSNILGVRSRIEVVLDPS